LIGQSSRAIDLLELCPIRSSGGYSIAPVTAGDDRFLAMTIPWRPNLL
jgi:hypothetical protein